MPTYEHHISEESILDIKEVDEETAFTVAWVRDVLKHHYIDPEVVELRKAAEGFDNPVLANVPGLDIDAVAALKQQIDDACKKRTTEGLADLLERYRNLEQRVEIVVRWNEYSGFTHTTLEGLDIADGDKIVPVWRHGIIEGEVLEVSYQGERWRL